MGSLTHAACDNGVSGVSGLPPLRLPSSPPHTRGRTATRPPGVRAAVRQSDTLLLAVR